MTSATVARPPALDIAGRAARALAQAIGVASLVVLVGLSMRLATAGTARPSFLVPSGRRFGYPSWMHGPLTGTSLSVRGFVAVMTAMIITWLVALVFVRTLPAWIIAVAVLLAVVTFTLAPPLLSTDVFNYIAYGRIQTQGFSPYVHGPAILPLDPVFPYIGHLWEHTPSAYGPLFTLLSYGLAPLGIASGLWLLKAVTGLACLAIAGLTWASAHRLGRSPSFALAIVCLNPALLVYGVGGAHNDVLMAAFLAAAIYLSVSGRAVWAGSALAAAMAIKVTAGLAVPFMFLGTRPRRRFLYGLVGAAALLLAISLAVYGSALSNMIETLRTQRQFNSIVANAPTWIAYHVQLARPVPHTFRVFEEIFAAIVAGLLVVSRRGRWWIEGTAVASLVLVVAAPWVLPWYVVLALPFAALGRQPAVPMAAAVVTLLVLAIQLDHVNRSLHEHHHHHAVHHVHRAHAGPSTGHTRRPATGVRG